MIPLVKIRLIFIKRNRGKIFFFYYFPGIIMLFIIFISIITGKFRRRFLDTYIDFKDYNIRRFPENKYYLREVKKLGIITNEQKIINEFNNSFKNYNISIEHLKDYNKISDYKDYIGVVEIIKNENLYKFKLKTNAILIDKLFSDEESDLLIPVSSYFGYFTSFLSFHIHNILLNLDNKKGKNITVYSYEMYYPSSHLDSKYYINIYYIYIIPLIISFIYGIIFIGISLRMIDEKNHKLDLLLSRYGIKKYQYFFSWLITYLFNTIFLSICVIVTFSLLVFKNLVPDMIIFAITHMIFSIGIFSMAFFTQTVVNTLRTGQTLFRLLFFGIGIIAIPIIIFDTPKFLKIIFSLFPHIAQIENLQILLLLQNFNRPKFQFYFSKYHKVSFFESLFYLIFDNFLYIFGSFFIYSYKESGVDFKTFILSPIYGKRREIKEENNNTNKFFELNCYHEELSQNNKLLKEQNRILDIKNITKKYDDLIAVNNFNGQLFLNEIFCLLGHNGAGKTTLIKLISGMEDPNEGDIFLNNKSLITNKDYLYENIGLCSQDDIFFDYLTVDEHLRYMCEIKGSKSNIYEINDLLTRIDLLHKQYYECKTLSGGQKRKLCIALALIGNSQLILLDEPTSGMDIIARRALWNFLKSYKKNKIILLTTHSLEEAEYLGDRIGIMNEGFFICSGSSSYLKDKYPCGYNINLILNPQKFTNEIKQNFLSEIRKIYENITIKISSKSLLSISCDVIDNRTKDIFSYIERNKEEFGIKDYTIGTTSLEDVFLKLNINERKKNMDENVLQKENNIDLKYSSFCEQLYENIKRNLIPLWRIKINFITELISSLVLLIIFIYVFHAFVINDNSKYKNYSKLLESNKIYVDEKTKKYLENSALVQNEGIKVNYELMDFKPQYFNNSIRNTLYFFVKDFYEHSNLYNEKVAMFHEENDTHIEFFLLYHEGNCYYEQIMNVLASSAYLKKLGINAILFEEYANFPKNLNCNKEFETDFIIYSLSILIFSFISFSAFSLNQIVKEKETNVKHLLYLSGANIYSYWLGFLVIDLIKYFIFLLISFSILIYYNYIFYRNILPIFIGFCFPMSIFLYVLSFFIDKEEDSLKSYFIFLIMIFVFVPSIYLLVYVILNYYFTSILRFFSSNTYNWFFITPFELTPITSFGFALYRVGRLTLDKYYYKPYISQNEPYLLIIYHTCYFIIQFFIWSFILLSFEKGCLVNLKRKCFTCFCLKRKYEFATSIPINDGYIIQPTINTFHSQKNNYINNSNSIFNINDVSINNSLNFNNINDEINDEINTNSSLNNNINEPLLIENDINKELEVNEFVYKQMKIVNNNLDLTTKISGLTKTFCFCCKKNLRAVNNLYLGLERNEKFGLLGFNGSGKSTIFKCITNEIYYDSGEISLFGYNTKSSFNDLRKITGYCPQENPLFEFLTVRETLNFYKSLKKSEETIENICSKFGIEKYIDKYCVDLSGGNKRKLTFAIALMNYPKILLLDEPSTGVDPENRRIMWKNINELSKNEYNMILTTHSMEEAEVLCDTVSWLKSGNFICFGNPEQLKILYSTGYKLHIKFRDDKIYINIKEGKYENKNLCDLNVQGGVFINGLLNQIQNYNFIGGNYNYYHLGFYVDSLYNILFLIRDKCDKISVKEIGKDYSFELNIIVKKEKQSELFHQILNMKTTNEIINEIHINMESLENILTNL